MSAASNRRTGRSMMALGVTVVLALALWVPTAAHGPFRAGSDGVDGVFMVEPNGRWHVTSDSGTDHRFFFGNPGDVPLLGDWDGDGADTPGVFRPDSGFVYLTNALPVEGGVGVGESDLTFYFGMAGDQVLVGDWDGNGADSLGLRRGREVFLTNINATAVAEISFTFGMPGDVAYGGDPTGRGTDGVFLHRPARGQVMYTDPLREESVPSTLGPFFYGVPGDRLVVGDWDADGTDTVGVFRPGESSLHLRNENSSGAADSVRSLGRPDWQPVVGRIDAVTVSPPTTTTTLAATTTTTTPTTTTTTIPDAFPPPGFKVAIIGDSGDGESFRRVLTLIRDQGADIVVHNGDFSYADGPTSAWTSAIDEILGADFPYVGSDGNHDVWSQYTGFFGDRLGSMGVNVDAGSLASAAYGFTFNNVRFVFSPEGGDPGHVADAFAADPDPVWRIAGWHKNMTAMQVETKGDEQGWGDYEAARAAGAIITSGHAHSYSRTKTLSDISDQVIALDDPFATELRPGQTFVVVSGLGGRPVRAQDRCLPADPPYGCPEWASIYTASQGATHGALFVTMHVDGDPISGLGQFINVDGEVIDEFTISVEA